jgi:hypothetical protein
MRGRLSILVLVLAGCAAVPQTGATPTSSPAPTATPSATPTASPTVAPTAAPTASPEPFVIKWTRSSVNPGVADFLEVRRLRPFQGRFVLLGSSGKVWTTEDGLRWQQTSGITGGTNVEVHDLTVGGPGMVAVGQDFSDDGERAAVWTSTDGKTWTAVANQAVFLNGEMNQVGGTDAGVVAFGGNVAWTSADGLRWQRATDATSRHIAQGITRLISLDDRLVAFVNRKSPSGSLEVWQRTGAAWTKVADLPHSTGGIVRQAARGPRGWVAMGAVGIHDLPTVWTSQDGTHWVLASETSAFKGTTFRYLIALNAGFVAVGFSGEEPGTTCGTGEPVIGHTWTSTDGSTWREMAHEGQFNRAVLYALYARNDTLFMLGGFFPPRSGERTTVWTARLPATAVSAQAARAVRGAPGAGCGP